MAGVSIALIDTSAMALVFISVKDRGSGAKTALTSPTGAMAPVGSISADSALTTGITTNPVAPVQARD